MMEKVLALVFLSMSLDLIFAQVVTFEPATFNAAVGTIASTRCHLVPDTESKIDYFWYDIKGGPVTSRNSNDGKWLREPLMGGKGLSLYVRVTDDDEGSYKCKIVVDGNEYEGFFRLDVYAPITFTNCPEQQHGVRGREGKMVCSATAGEVNVVPFWERNGAVVRPQDDPRYRFDGTDLVISNITEADKGVYRYTAVPSANSGLSVKSKDINFDVWTVPVITKPVLETTGVDGGNATLYCEAIGHPDVAFTWYKESSMVRDTGRIKIERFKHQSQLQFRPVKKDDRGQYRCEVNNAAGTAESSTQVIVQTPPRILDMRNLTRTENNGATIWCNATGDPRPRMELVKMDSEYRITAGDQSQGWTASSGDLGDRNNPGTWFKLDIASVKYQDAGNYKCEALNNAGNDNAVVHLEVHFAPKSDQQPDGPFYNWVGNQDGHLPCVASANPLPVFRWLRADGNEITSADPFFSVVREEHRNDKVKYPKQEKEKFTVTSKLMITYNGQNDGAVFGDFRCEARNTINKTITVLTMTKAVAPGPPTYSLAREMPTLVNISFVAQGVAGPPVDLFKAVISETGSAKDPRVVTVRAEWREWSDDLAGGEKRTVMTIRDLEPQTRYSITLYAVNAVGEGTPVELSYTTKARSIPSSVPILSEVNSPYPGAILVRWNKPEDGGSPVLHYLVGYREVEVKNTTNPTGGYDYSGPVHNQDFKDVQVKANNLRYTIQNLRAGKYYQVRVKAVNNIGESLPLTKIIRTKEAELAPGATTAPPPVRGVRADDLGLSTGIIIGIVIAIFVVLFIIVDLTCYFKNNCGILMCIREKIAGARDEGYSAAKTDDVETLAKKDQLEDAKSTEEGEMAAEQEEEKKEPLLSEEQTVETVDEGEKKTEEMEPEDKEVAKQPETIENKENEAAQEAKTEEKTDEEKKG